MGAFCSTPASFLYYTTASISSFLQTRTSTTSSNTQHTGTSLLHTALTHDDLIISKPIFAGLVLPPLQCRTPQLKPCTRSRPTGGESPRGASPTGTRRGVLARLLSGNHYNSTNASTPSASLLSLPLELLITIFHDPNLPSNDLLSLSRTCKAFKHLLAGRIPQLSVVEQAQFRFAVRRDHLLMFNRDALYENVQGIRRAGKALCSACVRIHDTTLFTTEQLSVPATQRVCRGREGRIWLCEHQSLSRDHVLWLVNHGIGDHAGRNMRQVGCQRDCVRSGGSDGRGGCRPDSKGEGPWIIKEKDGMVCLRDNVCLRWSGEDAAPTLTAGFRRNRFVFCRHWEEICAELLKVAVGRSERDSIFTFQCNAEGCGAEMQVSVRVINIKEWAGKEWETEVRGKLRINVKRNLGRMEDVNDEAWCMQAMSEPHALRDVEVKVVKGGSDSVSSPYCNAVMLCSIR